jgi:glioma pathogenesis-related protein 2
MLILGAAMTGVGSGQGAETDQFRRVMARSHNELRARHGAPPLVLDEGLNVYAQHWANQLAASKTFRHSSGDYGENLYYASSSSGIDAAAAAGGATGSWYGESARYRYGSGFSQATGHFTQLVWKGSVRLGCGMARAADGAMDSVYIVCSYDPPGNVTNEFRQNVLPPR